MDKKINWGTLKIYWTAVVWAKWQVIIPKDIREDFSLDTWIFLKTLIFDNKFIWLFKTTESMMNVLNEKSSNEWCKTDIWESITIWSNYQFVIPSNIRKIIDLSPWDIMVFIWKDDWFWIFKNNQIDVFFDYIKEELK